VVETSRPLVDAGQRRARRGIPQRRGDGRDQRSRHRIRTAQYMVAQLRPQRVVDGLRRRGIDREFDSQVAGDARHLRAPVGEQRLVAQQRAGQPARSGFGLGHVPGPQQFAHRARHRVASFQRAGDFHRIAHHQQRARDNPHRLHDLPPQRKQPAQPRVLQRPQPLPREFALHQRRDRAPGVAGGGRPEPVGRHRAGVVPRHAQAGEQRFVDGDGRGMLPETFRIVVGGRQHLRTQRSAEEIEHPRRGRRAAAMHSQDEDRRTIDRTRRPICG
jgi:hypothetical protein